MRIHTTFLSLLAALLATTGCKDIECGDGTIERDGTCQPANATTSGAMCGPFTELQGDQCAPQFPPTECDPATTVPDVDPETGVTTCIGTGGGGCSAPFACPQPTMSGRTTICGQLYDFETMAKFQAQDASGAACDPNAPAATGPCALSIRTYDAVQFSSNPMAAPMLANTGVYIDDCGRYRVLEVDNSGPSPFIGLGIDDAAGLGPTGVTVTTGVATPKASPVVSNFEGFIVKGSTIQAWTTSGGPSLANGIYVAAYRAHKLRTGVDRHAPQAGVTFAENSAAAHTDDDFYFQAAQTTNTTVDPAATMTGANGSVLVKDRSIGEGVEFDGLGGLGTGCRWEPHAAATIPGVVFIQIFRKGDMPGQPGSCND